MSENLAYLPESFSSGITAVADIRNSFLIGFGLFLVTLPIIRSRNSFFDATVAKRVLIVVRVVSILEMIWITPLLYSAVYLGYPIMNPGISDDNSFRWVYGFGRPSVGLTLIFFGIVAGMHPVARLLCIAGSLQAIVFDSISAFQVRDYAVQITDKLAPLSGNFSFGMLLLYYYRDVISILICSFLLMVTSFAVLVVGFCNPQVVPYMKLATEDLDRCEVMRQQNQIRQSRDNLFMSGVEGVNAKQLRVSRTTNVNQVRTQRLMDDSKKHRANSSSL